MKGLIQRVASAHVDIDGNCVGKIGQGILLLLGIESEDEEKNADKLVNKVISYRLFSDAQGKMNLSVRDIDGGILVVSQFTLAADTHKGLRPSFTPAAQPLQAKRLYDYFVDRLRESHHQIATGVFAADMQVSLVNDGPVTFLLNT